MPQHSVSLRMCTKMLRLFACVYLAVLATTSIASAEQRLFWFGIENGDRVVFRAPAGWAPPEVQEGPNMTMAEYLPAGQTFENWDSIVTAMIIRSDGKRSTFDLFFRTHLEALKSSCSEMLDERPASGSQKHAIGLYDEYSMSCVIDPKTDRPEHVYLRAVETISITAFQLNEIEDAILVFQYAEHFGRFGTPATNSERQAGKAAMRETQAYLQTYSGMCSRSETRPLCDH